jgi:hypothetical protein
MTAAAFRERCRLATAAVAVAAQAQHVQQEQRGRTWWKAGKESLEAPSVHSDSDSEPAKREKGIHGCYGGWAAAAAAMAAWRTKAALAGRRRKMSRKWAELMAQVAILDGTFRHGGRGDNDDDDVWDMGALRPRGNHRGEATALYAADMAATTPLGSSERQASQG